MTNIRFHTFSDDLTGNGINEAIRRKGLAERGISESSGDQGSSETKSSSDSSDSITIVDEKVRMKKTVGLVSGTSLIVGTIIGES